MRTGLTSPTSTLLFPDLYAALAEALRCIRELMADASPLGRMRFEIADETGRVLLVVPIYGAAPHETHRQAA
jgi:hypothetical protein